jgi:hypothetical protein
MMAVGWADMVTAGLAAAGAAAAGFLAGGVFGAGAVCDHAAEHVTETSKQIEKQIRMDAPQPGLARPGR